MLPVSCNWALAQYKKHSVSPVLIQEEFIEVQKKYADFTHFYANGAKTSTFAGSGLYSDDFAQAERLSCVASIFTAELYGALLALQCIATTKVIKALLFEDFQSVAALLCSLGDTKYKPVKLVQHKINRAAWNSDLLLGSAGSQVTFLSQAMRGQTSWLVLQTISRKTHMAYPP